ncbi:MAG TPA: MBL fold metallo-hydrolase [Vicinamibacteria bacterium]|nr:MBL fold metallo-hydrolase [Vicinamibacteria bacterium]
MDGHSGPPEASPVPSVEVGELIEGLDRGQDVVLLDVRNDDEFSGWRLEARRPVTTVHVPYFDFIEDAEGALARVPRGHDVVVLCAQGGSSEMVAGMLGEGGVPSRNVKGGMVAYGDFLQPVRVPLRPEEASRFELWQVNRRGKGCLSYVIRSGDEAVVVDPSRRVEWYESFVAGRGARIVRVLDTHVQADHVSGGPALAARLGVPYSVAADEGFELGHPVAPLSDGQELRLGGLGGVGIEVKVLKTPGHTPGSTSYLVGGRYLLTGDTLFVAGVGRPDLGGHVEAWGRALFQTLTERLAALPDETAVLPAHYGGVDEIGPDGVVWGRLGTLRRTVPEMQLRTPEEFVAAVRAAVTSPPEAYAHIIRVNLGAMTATAEAIGGWELGKNECAVAAQRRAAPARGETT